jgi:hypothetical protein
VSHPIDKVLPRMSRRDREIAEELMEDGFTEEDLYQALPNPGADKLLKQPKNKVRHDC